MYINQDIIEKKKRNSYRKFFTFFSSHLIYRHIEFV